VKSVGLDLSAITSEADEDGSSSDSETIAFDKDINAADAGEKVSNKHKDFLLVADRREVTFEMIDEKLKDIIASRGKKGTDRHVAVNQLSYMATLAKCPAQEVEILLHIISAQFDAAGSMSTHMPLSIWRNCLGNVLRLIALLKENTHISLVERDEPSSRPTRDDLLAGAPVQLGGSLCAFTERLDDEYLKSLQQIDPHTKDYVLRLRDECFLLVLLHEVLAYYVAHQNSVARVKLSLRLLGHVYYKTSAIYKGMSDFISCQLLEVNNKESCAPCQSNETSSFESYCVEVDKSIAESYAFWFPKGFYFPDRSLQMLLRDLTLSIYDIGDERSKVRAILFDTFHKSLCGEFTLAREQLLMSHLQESIHLVDIETQVLFNRCMAQLGVTAFQSGLFHEAKACLSDILSSGRSKELLAQGVSPSRHAPERNFEQEKLERRRQVPFHMHIDIELLESIYLVSCMLGETHLVLTKSKHPRANNRTFLRMIEVFERQTFSGPPEGVRDTVMCATKYLIDGEWGSAAYCITGMNTWALLPGSRDSTASVLLLVVDELKQEALRTFISQRAAQYDSLCLETLCDMFDLPISVVQSNVSKLFATGVLVGSCDSPTCTFAIQTSEPSFLQTAVVLLAESVTVFLDANERALGVRVDSDGALALEDEDTYLKPRGFRASQIEERDVLKLKGTRSLHSKNNWQRGTFHPTGNDSRVRRQDHFRDKPTKGEQ